MTLYTTAQIADLLGARTWQVRRLYEDGTLAEPGRFGRMRVIPSRDIPVIVDALRDRGWLPVRSEESTA